MVWNFEQLAQYFGEYAGELNLSGAVGFFEWTSGDGFNLSNYPAVREDLPPTEDASENQARLIWVKINAGAWQQLTTVAQVTNIGIGTVGALTGGVSASIVVKSWPAKGIGFGFVLGNSASLVQIQSDRTQGILIVRCDIAPDGTITVVTDWNQAITQVQLNALYTWLGDHSATQEEFYTVLGFASPAEGQAWMLTHTRREFLELVLERWG